MFYAFEHAYGAYMCDDRGNAIGTVLAFESRGARDFYVNQSRLRAPLLSDNKYAQVVTVRWLKLNHYDVEDPDQREMWRERTQQLEAEIVNEQPI